MMQKKLISFLPLIAVLALLVLTGCGPDRYYYNDPAYRRPVYIAPGVGLGTIVAVVVSWSRNKSILWAIVHGILGWLYVIYAILVRKR